MCIYKAYYSIYCKNVVKFRIVSVLSSVSVILRGRKNLFLLITVNRMVLNLHLHQAYCLTWPLSTSYLLLSFIDLYFVFTYLDLDYKPVNLSNGYVLTVTFPLQLITIFTYLIINIYIKCS